ncbi:MAG: pilin [Candidatus Uhrbacteria bacterium]
MKKRITIILFILSFFFFLSPAFAATADETCNCWCGLEGEGAMLVGKIEPAACDTACDDVDYDKIVCTNNLQASPPVDLTCWSADECANWNGVWGGSTGLDEPTPKHCSGGEPEEASCYPAPEAMPLNILIGAPGQEIGQVEDLAQYVAAWYQWLLYAGIIIATVMIMIGGVQYMVSKGMGSVDSAKKRIQGAVVGLILLFGAYVILATVNPQLVLLQIPQYPMIKQVVYIDDSTRCEKLLSVGYKLESAGTVYDNPAVLARAVAAGQYQDFTCGKQANVLESPNGGAATIETCYWSICTGNGESCMLPNNPDSETEPVPLCLSCEDISYNNDYGIAPSSLLCNSLSLKTTRDAGKAPIINRCFYTAEVIGEVDAILGGTSCAMAKIDCNVVDRCGYYGGQDVTFHGGSVKMGKIVFGEYNLQEVCNSDPCLIKARAGLERGCIATTLYNDGAYTGMCVIDNGNIDTGLYEYY